MNHESPCDDTAVTDVSSDTAVDIVKADPDARRRVIIAIVALTVVLAALLYLVVSRLETLKATSAVDPRAAIRQLSLLLWATAGLAAAMAAAMAAILARLALKVRRAERYPLPGALLLRDTPLRTGLEARRLASASLVLACLLAFAAAGVLATTWWLWRIIAW